LGIGLVAFDNNFNDINVIQDYGFGIAIDNIKERFIQAADEICSGNYDDGVTKWLGEHLLNLGREFRAMPRMPEFPYLYNGEKEYYGNKNDKAASRATGFKRTAPAFGRIG